ncbi:hypothetical protein DALLNEIH_03686 [Bacillus sp. B01(2024)]|uniref:hypothetical protein n=1 Tax=Bacillus siamensis TaxID=659243 RepID=UPI0039E15C14
MRCKKSIVLTMLLFLIANTLLIHHASAAPAGSGRGSSSSGAGRVSSPSRSISISLNKSAINSVRNATRSSSAAASSSVMYKSNRSNSFNSVQRSLNKTTLYKGSIKSTLNQRASAQHFQNFYFPYWFIFGSQHFSQGQEQTLTNLGAKVNDVKLSQETRYWLLIEDKHKKEHAVLVSKKQYESVNVGNEVQLKNKEMIIKKTN